jgi:hypothetical protein
LRNEGPHDVFTSPHTVRMVGQDYIMRMDEVRCRIFGVIA